MIRELTNRKNKLAVTSDHWHVIHARLTTESAAKPRFLRSIVSEHDDRSSAVTAAQELTATFAPEITNRAAGARDQVFVRKPEFKSLKIAKRLKKNPK